MISSPQMNFARRLVYLKKQLIDFTGRPYLPPIYASTGRNLVVAPADRSRNLHFWPTPFCTCRLPVPASRFCSYARGWNRLGYLLELA